MANRSKEGRIADRIINALDTKSLNNDMLAYFLKEDMSDREMSDFLDVFFHVIRRFRDDEPPEYISADYARIMILADSVVRAVEEAGLTFN